VGSEFTTLQNIDKRRKSEDEGIKYGFLAAVGIHFWTDVIWHVIWGMISFL
jgi:hypothetical protein